MGKTERKIRGNGKARKAEAPQETATVEQPVMELMVGGKNIMEQFGSISISVKYHAMTGQVLPDSNINFNGLDLLQVYSILNLFANKVFAQLMAESASLKKQVEELRGRIAESEKAFEEVRP